MIRNKGKHVFSLLMASALMMGVVNAPAHATDITTSTTSSAVTFEETNPAADTIIKPGETVEIKNTSGVKYRLSLKDNTSDIKVDYVTYLADGKGYELANDVADKAKLAYVFNNATTKVTNEGTSDLQIHCIDITNALNPVVADNKVTITRVQEEAIATATVQPNETYPIVNFTEKTTTVYYDSPSTEIEYRSYKDDATKGTGITMQHSYSITKSIGNNTRADVTNTNSIPMTLFFEGNFKNSPK